VRGGLTALRYDVHTVEWWTIDMRLERVIESPFVPPVNERQAWEMGY
jgi:hypothetical protein